MSEDNGMKVYTVLKNFEAGGKSYEAGAKYELADEDVKDLEAGLIEVFVAPVEEETETKTDSAAPETANAATDEKKEEAVPAEKWVGQHTVGRE